MSKPKKRGWKKNLEGIFIAVKDGFICSDCLLPAEVKTLGDTNVEVWEEYSGGWTAPCVCKRCHLSIPVYVDSEYVKLPRRR